MEKHDTNVITAAMQQEYWPYIVLQCVIKMRIVSVYSCTAVEANAIPHMAFDNGPESRGRDVTVGNNC